jgi:hypothetical protein
MSFRYYKLPIVSAVQIPLRPEETSSWVTPGMRVRVIGAYFQDNNLLRCRLKGEALKGEAKTSLAHYIDDGTLECTVDYSLGLGEGGIRYLEVSNDGGARWASGLTVNTPIKWYGGSTIAVAPRTVTYPQTVVIGCTIPGAGGEYRVFKQAFEAAAKTVNNANIFPQSTTLKVEIIDTEGIGATAATNAVASFVESMTSAPVIGLVGGFWSTNSIGIASNVSNPLYLPVRLPPPLPKPLFPMPCVANSPIFHHT